MTKLTKTEQKILDRVRKGNDAGALIGLPCRPDGETEGREGEFCKRLALKGLITYVAWTPRLGAGWTLADRDPHNPSSTRK